MNKTVLAIYPEFLFISSSLIFEMYFSSVPVKNPTSVLLSLPCHLTFPLSEVHLITPNTQLKFQL